MLIAVTPDCIFMEVSDGPLLETVLDYMGLSLILQGHSFYYTDTFILQSIKQP